MQSLFMPYPFQTAMLIPPSRKAMSVLKVEYPDTMDETKTRVKIGGLLDPRLGTIGICFPVAFANS